jgi:hypothetical protein
VLLPLAERLLQDGPTDGGRPGAPVSLEVTLGGVEFLLCVSDEQAKANVNVLAHRLGRDVAADCIADLLGPCRRAPVVELRPARPPVRAVSKVPANYGSLDQVFARYQKPSELMATGSDEPAPLDYVTCWGSGKLNVRRADESVIRHVTSGLLTDEQVHKLVELRELATSTELTGLAGSTDLPKRPPGFDLQTALKRVALPADRSRPVLDVLTEGSSCHSLWVTARGATRNWYRLYVDQVGDAENDSRRWAFEW